MKKILLCALIALVTGSAHGQGGSWYIGGVGSFSSSSSDANLNPTSSSWTIGPELGTFFNANWSAGLVLKFQGANASDDDGDIYKMSLMSPDLYGRRWWKAGERLSIFTGLDVAFGSGSTTYFSNDSGSVVETEVDNSSFNVNLNAGVAYGLADRWTLLFKFAGLGYSSLTEGDETTNTFGFVADGNITTNQFVFIGLYFTFKQASAAP